jgi:hypothetical protein
VGIVPEEPLVVTLPVAETVAPVAKDAPLPVKAAKPKKPKAKIKKAAAKKDSPAGKKAVKAVPTEEPVQDAAPPAVSALADPAPEPVEAGPAPVEPVAVTQSAARSRVAESIRAALERLVQEQEDFGELARRTAAQKIRDQLGASYEKGNGLSDPNLSRYIRRKCGPKLSRPKA